MLPDQRTRRLQIWMPLLFAIVLAGGMTLGFRLRDTLRNKRSIETVILDRNDRLDQIIDLIQERYVDSVNVNGLYSDAVAGIISHLDPHTSYIPESEVGEVNDDLNGSFFGIGVEFNILRDTLHIVDVVENGPAQRAGIETGDRIIRVNDSLVAGVGITSERIIAMLRGEKFSQAALSLLSAGNAKTKKVVVKRDAVPIVSVEAYLMLDATTGYLKINRFSATTHREFIQSVQKLQAAGMKQLVVDVRQNPGGFLDQATSVADELIGGTQTLVVTRNRKDEIVTKAERPGIFEEGKLAILTDEGSASASEILAGAVQDCDRGVIIGRRTFGKGLVQEQYELSDGSALRLTTARYYTPSGRSVQRSFAGGREAYDDDYRNRFKTGELSSASADTLVHAADTAKYYTSQRRVVRGGGGIAPDIFIPYDSVILSPTLLSIAYGDEASAALWDYYTAHSDSLRQYKTAAQLVQDKGLAQRLTQAVVNSLPAADRKQIEVLLKKPVSAAYIQRHLLSRLARTLLHANGYYAILMPDDPAVKRALALFANTAAYDRLIGRQPR